MRLQNLDPVNRIAATKRQQRIAHPIAPGLKAAERTAAFEVLRILSTEPPVRRGRRNQLNPVLLDLFKEARTKRAALRVLAARIEFAGDKAASKIFRYG